MTNTATKSGKTGIKIDYKSILNIKLHVGLEWVIIIEEEYDNNKL